MNYHNILHDNMNNGDGLRVVLFVSGCQHKCVGCHNKITWDCNGGIEFDQQSKEEIYEQLDKDYISGITLTGGDPLYRTNLTDILNLVTDIKEKYKDKTIWLYTGFTLGQLINNETEDEFIRYSILNKTDVLVDGLYVEELKDTSYKWAGSTNQRVIDVQETLKLNKIVLHS